MAAKVWRFSTGPPGVNSYVADHHMLLAGSIMAYNFTKTLGNKDFKRKY